MEGWKQQRTEESNRSITPPLLRSFLFTLESHDDPSYGATLRNQQVQLDHPIDWPDGTRLIVTPEFPLRTSCSIDSHVIIVGFGLAGRCVVDLLDGAKVPYTIVEKNPVTVETQRALGRNIIEGRASDTQTLIDAGLNTADILALTIPDEGAVLRATSLARRLRPKIHIIARTNYSSKGMRAVQLGADEVIKAEQAVALQFYEKVRKKLSQPQKEKV